MVPCSTGNVFYMRQFCRFFNFLAWFDTVEFNGLPCSNDKKYDDVVFDDRFRYQLTMFGIRLLIGLYPLLHIHIAYEIDPSKSSQHSAEFPIDCMIWYGWIQSSAMFNTRIYDKVVFAERFRYQLTMFEEGSLIRLSRLLTTHIAHEIVI